MIEGSGSNSSQVTSEIVSILGESEEDDPGGIRLAESQENWTLA